MSLVSRFHSVDSIQMHNRSFRRIGGAGRGLCIFPSSEHCAARRTVTPRRYGGGGFVTRRTAVCPSALRQVFFQRTDKPKNSTVKVNFFFCIVRLGTLLQPFSYSTILGHYAAAPEFFGAG